MSAKHQLTDQEQFHTESTFELHCIEELRNANFRITMPRVQVVRALADIDTAMSAYDLHERIRKMGGRIDVVSVYRILNTLEEVGLVTKVGVAGGYFPVRASEGALHRTMVIVSDEDASIVEVVPTTAIIKEIEGIAAEHGFDLSEIRIEVRGAAPKR